MDQSFILIAVMFGFMYFFLIRPQKKQLEARNQMMENLSPDDIITTIGGIKGKIITIMEDSIILEIAENIQVEFLKTAVGQVVTDDDEYDDDEEDEEEFYDDDEEDDDIEKSL